MICVSIWQFRLVNSAATERLHVQSVIRRLNVAFNETAELGKRMDWAEAQCLVLIL
jgi:hypothetical protein